MKTVFLRVLEADDKAAALRAGIREREVARGRQRFDVDATSFTAMPCSPFAYWVSDRLRQLFNEFPHFEGEGRRVVGGLKTLSDERFVRAWWEVPIGNDESWPGLAKGGAFSPFYADIFLRVNWRTKGNEISWYGYQRRPREGFGAASRGAEEYFRPGLTWPRRTQAFGVRVMPAGCIFGDKGPAAFIGSDREESLLAYLALLTSKAINALVGVSLNAADATARSYEVGAIQRIPTPHFGPSDQVDLANLARRAWSLKRSLDTNTEASHAFTLPALLQVKRDTLAARSKDWTECVRASEAEIATIQAEIDARCFHLYGINKVDCRTITEGFGSVAAVSSELAEADVDADEDADDEDEGEGDADTTSLVPELVSWTVGVAFGRFDVRLATGARALPSEPQPFDSLPICSPAMLTGDDGLPLASAPANYSLAFPESGIMVDDPGHRHDLTTAVRAVFDVVFGTRADAIWQEAGALLDPKDHDLRTWISLSFFEYHIKRYSKSRRKAPILWQLGVPSGRYSVWLYAHRLTRDSFFQLQNDVVATKLAHEEHQLRSLVQHAGGSLSAKERKEIAAQEVFVEELRGLLEEVKRIAPLWNPTLDDGVVLTMAPLWRLVPQHKPWQKELKSRWDELCAGKYDWAHLAMHLWPERVVPKCATDRSLAIAHGLAEVFWVQDADDKWQLRARPTRPVEEIVREHSSPAVKAALGSLLEAAIAAVGDSRGRRRAEVIV